jgi:hypothetical protein
MRLNINFITMKKLYPAAALAILLLGSFSLIKTRTSFSNYPRALRDTTSSLPDAYKNRHFLSDEGGNVDDPASVPGNLVKYDAATSTYQIMTMKAIVKNNAVATMQKLNNAVIYQGQVDSTSSFNGSYVINGLKAKKCQVIDLMISDDAVYSLQPEQIDTASAVAAAKSMSADDRKNYFYVTAATVVVFSYKFQAVETAIDRANKKADKVNKALDKLSKNDTTKKGVYLKIKPSKTNDSAAFNSHDGKTLTDKAISLQLTPIDDLVATTKK